MRRVLTCPVCKYPAAETWDTDTHTHCQCPACGSGESWERTGE